MASKLASKSGKRPNILLFMSDNQSADFLGSYGNSEVKTPALNALAKGGTKFTNAYCVNAMCSPCRASVLTGLMPSAHGIHTWLDDGLEAQWPDRWNAIGEFNALPDQLKAAGYTTALIGKYHLGKAWQPPSAFDHWVTFPHGHTVSFYGNRMIENDENYVFEGHSVDFFTDKTVQFLSDQEGSDTPFFAFVPFNGPYGHWPAIRGRAANEFAALYDETPLSSVPREGVNQRVIDRYTQRVLEAGQAPHERFAGPLRLPNDTDSLRNYFSQTSLIDKGVGRILAQLEASGFAENTIVIYTADHGFSLGNHGIWGHGLAAWPSSMLRPSYNIPLIMRGPGIAAATSDKLVSQLDLANTLLDAVGAPGLGGPRTDSRAIDLDNPRHAHRGALFMEQEESRAIRTADNLYIERFTHPGVDPLKSELYDLHSDPEERINLCDPQNCGDDAQMVMANLSTQLQDYFRQHSDPKRDLWAGGTPKSNITNSSFWQAAWGDKWGCTF